MLFDMESDPQELCDLGADPGQEAQCKRMAAALFEWSLRNAQRTTVPEARALHMRGRSMRRGILVGVWDEQELPSELWSRYRGQTD